jgi:hypothetical protein
MKREVQGRSSNNIVIIFFTSLICCFIFVLEVVKVCEHKLLFDAATIVSGALYNIS